MESRTAMKTGEPMELDEAAQAGALSRAVRATGPPMGGFRRGKGRDRRRILGGAGCASFYHVMSRTTGGDKLLGAVEKDAFLQIARRLERFSGVEILTHAVMANHFHLLVRVPDRERFLQQFDGEGGEEKLMKQLGLLYSQEHMLALQAELEDLRKLGMTAEAEELMERFRRRFCNLPMFAKELKERFSKWFNKLHGRAGTLWGARFKSVLVEDGEALRTMACYIDLNPVRAGLVDDPKDYRWCGYAEAVAGSEPARRGLVLVTGDPQVAWDKMPEDERQGPRTPAELYRGWLFERGVATESRRGVSQDKLEGVRKRAGGLSRGELIRCRVRYFTDGVAIGGKGFIEALFRERREVFSAKRRTGARQLREAPDVGLFSLRALKVRAVE